MNIGITMVIWGEAKTSTFADERETVASTLVDGRETIASTLCMDGGETIASIHVVDVAKWSHGA